MSVAMAAVRPGGGVSVAMAAVSCARSSKQCVHVHLHSI